MDFSTVFARFALGASFLSAVADRFGLWGAYGQPHVAWGNFNRFTVYTRTLLWFLPGTAFPVMAWIATAAEILFGLALIIGLFTRVVAFLSGILLFIFGAMMTFSLGIKAPLDFSVFSASAGALQTCGLDTLKFCVGGNSRTKQIEVVRNSSTFWLEIQWTAKPVNDHHTIAGANFTPQFSEHPVVRTNRQCVDAITASVSATAGPASQNGQSKHMAVSIRQRDRCFPKTPLHKPVKRHRYAKV